MVPEWSFELQNQPSDDGDTVEPSSQTTCRFKFHRLIGAFVPAVGLKLPSLKFPMLLSRLSNIENRK